MIIIPSNQNTMSPSLEADIGADHTIVRLHVRYAQAPETALSLTLAPPIPLDPMLVVDDHLMTLAQLRQLISTQQQAFNSLTEDVWRATVNALSHAAFVLEAEQRFCGATIFPAGVATIVARVTCDIGACLGGSMASAALEMQLDIAGECDANILGSALRARLAWQMRIDAQGAIPTMALRLPELGFQFPALQFAGFDWQTAACNPDAPFDFHLPAVPGIPFTVIHGPIHSSVTLHADTGAVTVSITVTDAAIKVSDATASFDLGSPALVYENGTLAITGLWPDPLRLTWEAAPNQTPLSAPLTGIGYQRGAGELRLELTTTPTLMVHGALRYTCSMAPASAPDHLITVDIVQPFENDNFVDHVTFHGEPIPVQTSVTLLAPTPMQLLGGLLKNAALPASVSLRLPFTQVPDMAPLADIVGELLAAIASGATGLAAVVAAGLRALCTLLRSGRDALTALDITLVLDSRSAALQQVLVCMCRSVNNTSDVVFDTSACFLRTPAGADLALLFDLRAGARDAYLIATVGAGAGVDILTLGTDLWFGGGDVEHAASAIDQQQSTSSADTDRLITIGVAQTTAPAGTAARLSVIPFGIRNGEPVFLQALHDPLPALGQASVTFAPCQLVELSGVAAVRATFPSFSDIGHRILPFLAAPRNQAPGTGVQGLVGQLKQYMQIDQITDRQITLEHGVFSTEAGVTVKVLDTAIKSTLVLELAARSLTLNVKAGALGFNPDHSFDLLGMQATFLQVPGATPGDRLVLDLRGGDTRLMLGDGWQLRLAFSQLSGDGPPLDFRVGRFVMHNAGIDLEAVLDGPSTIKLNGLDVEFTFQAARIAVSGGRITDFNLDATGQLPPALLGNVDVALHLAFGARTDGTIGLLDGSMELARKDQPVRCENTHFMLTLSAVSVRVFEDAGNLHFCAFVSGGATFKPQAAELSGSLLGKLAGLELRFTDCPIAGASEVVRRALERLNLSFIVALDTPLEARVFELFRFQVRCIGFMPHDQLFDDHPPALLVGGQIFFAEAGDVVSAEIDCHLLHLAVPAAGQWLPRLRCEGLGVALRFGASVEIDGLVVAVDGSVGNALLQSVSKVPAIAAKGFMGQGRVAIQGLPAVAAAFGFVEVQATAARGPVRAWFVFLEAQHLSYYFQVGPVPIYLREAGLGMGYGFTLVEFVAIDAADSLPALIKSLDTLGLSSGELSKLAHWTLPTDANDMKLTVAARILLTMSSASSQAEPLSWKPDEEEYLPNVFILEAVAALREDSFFMKATLWLGYNYRDWDKGRQVGQNPLSGKQAMYGYVLLSASRCEFLARLKSNRGAEVGPRLGLPAEFCSALTDIDYEAIIYMRPGLLHAEFGWPNRIRWSKNIAGVHLSVAGGAIFRVCDDAVLAALNLEGQLDFALEGRLDAGCVGVAVSASVLATIAARLIGYLDARRVANSLYYALYALNVNIQFRICAWLEIDAWLCKITIHIAFAMTLQISVVGEMALLGDASMGARMRAQLVVSIFGCTLSVGVGLGISPGVVDQAAQRVGRFMDLGLTLDLPATTPSLPQQDARNQAAADAGRERLEARHAVTAPPPGVPDNNGPAAAQPHEDPLPADIAPRNDHDTSVDIAEGDFHIVLTALTVVPAALPPGHMVNTTDWVYLSFLPLEAAPAADAAAQRGSFYAAPPEPPAGGVAPVDAGPDHEITLLADAAAHAFYIFSDNRWQEQRSATGETVLPTRVEWKATLPFAASTAPNGGAAQPGVPADHTGLAQLSGLFFSAFRTHAARLADVDTSAQKRYREPLARAAMGVPGAVARQAPVGEQASYASQERAYNQALIAVTPADRRCHESRDFLLQAFISDLFQLGADGVVPPRAHIARLGLTLLVPRAMLACCDGARLRKRILEQLSQPVTCRIFNPPERTFAYRTPRFDAIRVAFEDNKVHLDWDLVWPASQIEPEHYVQHYEVTRWLEIDGKPGPDAAPITAKRADLLVYDNAPAGGAARRVVQRNPWQYTDEFADISPAERAALSNPAFDVVVRYSVVPVCVSGTRGVPCSDFIIERRGQPVVVPIKRAIAVLVIDPATQAIKLEARIEAGDQPDDSHAGRHQRFWRVVLRGEAIVPAGFYGADGESARPLGAGLAAERTVQAGDLTVDFAVGERLSFPHGNGDETAELDKLGNPARLGELMHALRDTTTPRAFRLYVQAVWRDNERDVANSVLLPFELTVAIVRADGAARRLSRVDALELVRLPQPDDPVLAAVVWQDLSAQGGRAARLDLPPRCQFTPGPQPGDNVPDPAFAALTTLRWNVLPSGLDATTAARYRLRAGFEIFMRDRDAPGRPDAVALLSASLLAPDQAALTPAAVGDPRKWQAHYPSDRAKRVAGGTWYSDAESYLDWPAPLLRVELLPEPSSELIMGLLVNGPPDRIVLAMLQDDIAVNDIAFTCASGAGCQATWTLDAGTAWLTYQGPKTLRNDSGSVTDTTSLARDLRTALRGLRWVPPTDAGHTGWAFQLTPGWTYTGADGSDKPFALAPLVVPMPFDRELHPMIEAVLARMRRPGADAGARQLYELDRRPAPVLDARTLEDLLSAADPGADPRGWAILDRLGLGVTVRLFDTERDSFIDALQLQHQLDAALRDVSAAGLYPELAATDATLKKQIMRRLFVEVLLQPDGLTRRLRFDARDDAGDGTGAAPALAMLRISLRPAIIKHLAYRVRRISAGEASSTHQPGCVAKVIESGLIYSLDHQSLNDVLVAETAKTKRIGHTVVLRAPSLGTDVPGLADNLPGIAMTPAQDDPDNLLGVDAFGQFPTWNGWLTPERTDFDAPLQASVAKFLTTVARALRLPNLATDPAAKALLAQQWAGWTARFFDYAPDCGIDIDWPQLAWAAPDRGEPVRLAQDADGCLSLNMMEADGYAHRREWSILPQWRYEKLLTAAGHGDVFTTRRAAHMAFSTDAVVGMPAHAKCTLRRTAPLTPPAVVPAGRIGDTVWWWKDDDPPVYEREQDATSAASPPAYDAQQLRAEGFIRLGKQDGAQLVAVLPDHPELRLSKANTGVARRLSFAGSRSSHLLQVSDVDWCLRAGQADALAEPPRRIAAPFGNDAAPTGVDTVLRYLRGQGIALPVRSKTRMLSHLPHWYLHTIAVSVAAGRAVSEVTTARLSDAPVRLVSIDDGKLTLVAGHPWTRYHDQPDIRLDVVERTPAAARAHCIALTMGALRNRDTTDERTAEHWAGPLANLPDPLVVYDLALEGAKTPLRPRKTIMPLARIARAPQRSCAADAEPQAVYQVLQLAGDWSVACDCSLTPDSTGNYPLRITLAPYSAVLPLTNDGLATLRAALAGADYLRNDHLRVPGGWNGHWIEVLLKKLGGAAVPDTLVFGVPQLWNVLAVVGEPMRAALECLRTVFPVFGEWQTLAFTQPVDEPAWDALAAALQAWVAQLFASSTGLTDMIAAFYTPALTQIAAHHWPWPGSIAHRATLPVWSGAPLPACGAPLTLSPATDDNAPSPCMLISELMTDVEFQQAMQQAHADPVLQGYLTALRQRQRERALGGMCIRLRATRGDAVPLSLPPITLT
ncbi:hypothetical protein [Janthinobacterium sp. PC23-8]|uniref:hypothetical protein n=1 Tax=Janthinobacterium sp. PC23-8 TaxID=2012679 RepID=UPI00113FF15D|nr:hypothetical protein [Janthinobacterium sp. PC23-8]